MYSPLISVRPTLVPPALCSDSAGMNEPYLVASTDRYAAQYGACVVWLRPSIGVGEKWFSRFQFFWSH